MNREQLEHAIRAACTVSEDQELIIFGSQAILGQFPEAPAELRKSIEVDVSPKNKPEAVDRIDGALGENSPFHKTHGFYVHGVPIETAKLPKGWEKRTNKVQDYMDENKIGHCIEAHDLAASKLMAFREKDTEFVRRLILDVHTANNSAIICLGSALAYHDLTTFNPSRIDVAVPNNTDKFELNYPPINVYFFRENMHKAGIDVEERSYGMFKVYNKAKTVCDMFRYRNKLGEDLALEGLQNYLNRSDSNLNELSEYMKICRVKTVMEPYVKAMIAG